MNDYRLEDYMEVIDRTVKYLKSKYRWWGYEFDDLKQEAAVIFLKYKDRYDSSKGASFKTFIIKIIRYRLFDYVRSNNIAGYAWYSTRYRMEKGEYLVRYTLKKSEHEKFCDVENEAIKKVFVTYLYSAIKALKLKKDYEIIRLHFFEGITLKKIGEMFGVTESRISQMLTKCKKRLHASLLDYGIEQIGDL